MPGKRSLFSSVFHPAAACLKWATVLFVVVLWGCERDTAYLPGVDCEKCYQEKPEWGPLEIRVTVSEAYPFVPVTIYKGNIENNDVEYQDTTWQDPYIIDVPVDRYYSVTAQYQKDGHILYSVDGGKFRVRKSESACDEPCYYFSGGFFDARYRE
ncbi:MAG: hypothetical protein JW861_01645 [Bacteroidales bacterium]|nr:hypothetical protein [Bacteroidales bacterium]